MASQVDITGKQTGFRWPSHPLAPPVKPLRHCTINMPSFRCKKEVRGSHTHTNNTNKRPTLNKKSCEASDCIGLIDCEGSCRVAKTPTHRYTLLALVRSKLISRNQHSHIKTESTCHACTHRWRAAPWCSCLGLNHCLAHTLPESIPSFGACTNLSELRLQVSHSCQRAMRNRRSSS